MKYLTRIALENRRHLTLFLITILAMLTLTIATSMEMFSLKVLTSKGTDAFELFAPKQGKKLIQSDVILRADIEETIDQISKNDKINRKDAQKYLARYKRDNLVESAVAWLDKKMELLEKPKTLALLLVIVALFKGVSLFATRYTTKLLAIKVSRDLRLRYFEHIQSLPLHFYQKYNIGMLSSRVVTDAQIISDSLNFALINYIQTPFTMTIALIACFITSYELSILIFLGIPLIAGPIFYLAQKIKSVTRQLQSNQERFASVLIDFLRGIQTVKIFAMEAFSLRKYKEQNEEMAKLERRSARYDSVARPITHGMATALLAGVLFYGLFIAKMNLSQLLYFCAMLFTFYEPAKKFAEQNTYIQRGVVAAERMYEVLEIRPNIEDLPDAVPLKNLATTIEFDDVWFRYEEQWILKGLSFTINKGETIAICGPTGAGKSTIVQLLPRLYDVDKGEIRINGLSIRKYTQKSIREQIAFVPQKPFLFLDTIRENIAFGRDFSIEEVKEAANRAHADTFIEQLPDKYDTLLADAGLNLSGGQQQRLAIARALVKRSPILVMDEATSSLDNISESKIKQAIEALHGNVTQIIIAHRLSTIEKADRILYVSDGKLLASGTREECLESCPEFRQMWELHQKPETISA